MFKNEKIFIAGRFGMVGSAIERELRQNGYTNIVGESHASVDLTNQTAVGNFFCKEKPEYVFLAAAVVGGIHANNVLPATFIYSNLQIQNNIINVCYTHGVKKLLFLASSCIYPRMAPQPISEDALLSGKLEPTNEPYAVAKIAGITMCQSYNRQYGTDFISVMPTNLYGPNDNYDTNYSHVLPGMISKIYSAKVMRKDSVTLWGSGSPMREFLYVDDLAEACVFLMNNYSSNDIINIGTGQEISIKRLAYLIKEIIQFKGSIEFDSSKPDGTPRKLLDVSKINELGWKHKTELIDGIKETYHAYISGHKKRCVI